MDFGGRRNPDGQGFAGLRAIHALPSKGQQLDPQVRILSVRRITSFHRSVT
jgi:hypothetical protein